MSHEFFNQLKQLPRLLLLARNSNHSLAMLDSIRHDAQSTNRHACSSFLSRSAVTSRNARNLGRPSSVSL